MMLRKSDKGWMFAEERFLEDFIWDNLESSLDLIPLKRQFAIKGEYCDILAKTKNNQLVVLELKNCEDRYVIHQLTRYYHSLALEKPFKDAIDYNLPIKLIAIAPDFHKHNFVDRHYNKLEFEFIRFSVLEKSEKFYLRFHLSDRQEINITEPIPFIESDSTATNSKSEIQVAPPPKILVNFLDKLPLIKKRETLRLREKMLASSHRIKEIKVSNGILYGRGKTKPCCHLRFRRMTDHNFLKCYLWLPIPQKFLQSNRISGIGRMSIYTDPDFLDIKEITWCTEDGRFAKKSSIPIDEYLDKIGLNLKSSKIDRLFELAVQLNLERS
jgi:Endonuclease NucS